jgi:polysaccharide biosynthesis/export protein
MRIQ